MTAPNFYNITFCNGKNKWITDHFTLSGDILISIEEDNPRFNYCIDKKLVKENISTVFTEAMGSILKREVQIRCLSMLSEELVIRGSFEIAEISPEEDGYQNWSSEGNTSEQ